MRKRPMRVWAERTVPFNYHFALVNPDSIFFQYIFDVAGIVSEFRMHCFPHDEGIFFLEITKAENNEQTILSSTLESGTVKFEPFRVEAQDLISCSIRGTELQTRGVHIGYQFEEDRSEEEE